MTYKEREQKILELVNTNKIVSSRNLVSELQVPESTLRRDLARLEKEEKLIRFHGGAKARYEGLNSDYYESFDYPAANEKLAVAAQACGLIKEGDAVFLDAGTTCLTLARLLKPSGITVFTTSLSSAMELIRKGMEVVLIGGSVQNNIGASFGPDACEQISRHQFDKCFLTTTGIDRDAGFMTVYEEDIRIKQAVIRNSSQVYILADHTKFETAACLSFASGKEGILIGYGIPAAIQDRFSYIETKK